MRLLQPTVLYPSGAGEPATDESRLHELARRAWNRLGAGGATVFTGRDGTWAVVARAGAAEPAALRAWALGAGGIDGFRTRATSHGLGGGLFDPLTPVPSPVHAALAVRETGPEEDLVLLVHDSGPRRWRETEMAFLRQEARTAL
ncbi:MAG: hypothetical protein AB7I33_03225 [Gemmatimonadales bacterium]